MLPCKCRACGRLMPACERAAYGERCENCYAGMVAAYRGPRDGRRPSDERIRAIVLRIFAGN